jgi:hypothetical protein
MNLTLVAFYGEKPRPLAHFIEACQALIAAQLPQAFRPYELGQVHATIAGLEGLWQGESLLNANYLQRGERRAMDIAGLVGFLRTTARLPFGVRIGGFRRERSYGFESFARHPYERSFELQASNAAVAIGWPVAGEAFPPALDELRRELNRFNVLHKYHVDAASIDNDLFFVLGKAAPQVDRAAISDALRVQVAGMEPALIDVGAQSLSLVAYADPELPSASSLRIPIASIDADSDAGQLIARLEAASRHAQSAIR